MLRMDAYRQFKNLLFSGDLRPGQFVSQRELAGLLEVPLNPIREAIRQLECERLINVYPKKGIQIVEGDPKTINDAHDYRLLLETAAIRTFAAEAPSDLINEMRRMTEISIAALEGSPDGDNVLQSSLETAWDFHEAIIDFQENQIISHHYRLNSARIRLFRSYTYRSRIKEKLAPSLQHHLEILDACDQRNVEKAVDLVSQDIETSRAITLGLKSP